MISMTRLAVDGIVDGRAYAFYTLNQPARRARAVQQIV
jgi:hypothetical protein